MDFIKRRIRSLLHGLGYHVARRNTAAVGFHKLSDIERLLRARPRPVMFDVGANVGQTIHDFRSVCPKSIIHSFEPSPSAFAQLSNAVRSLPDIHLSNMALGSQTEEKVLFENSSSVMTSFLQPDKDCWGTIVAETRVNVRTLDQYCEEHAIGRIDLLKVDTQGFDLEVLKGARHLMQNNKIFLILIELTFSHQYKDGATFDEVAALLRLNGLRLVSFYSLKHANGLADWCDALFVNEELMAAGANES